MVELVGVQRTTQTATESTLVDQVISILPIVIVIGLAVIAVVIFIKWYLNKKELDKDIYVEDYKATIEQCKINKDSKWERSVFPFPKFLISTGIPVFINHPQLTHSKTEYNKLDNDGDSKTLNVLVGESYKLGTYVGHCYQMDGCFTILVKSSKSKVMGIFPKLIILKLREKHLQKIIDPDEKTKTKTIDIPPDNFSRSNEMIILNALAIEKINKYWYAVNQTDSGYVVDTKPYAYEDNIEIATQKQVYDLGRNLARLSAEFASGNPLVQILKKTDTTLGSE